MVRVNQFIALGAILALSLLTAHTAFAGPAGSTGDSFTVAGSASGNLWTTDPTGGGIALDEYTFQKFGSPEADFRLCATWAEGTAQVPVAIKVNDTGQFFIWHSILDGALVSFTFGNPATDTPVVMDYDGDGVDDVVVVRDNGGSLQWIVDQGDEPRETFLFGPAGSSPVPGNWDDSRAGDEPAVTKALGDGSSDIKTWYWGVPNTVIPTGFEYFGKASWADHAYTGSDGIMRPGTSHAPGPVTNAIDVTTAATQIRVNLGNPANSSPIGSCNL